MASHGAGRPLAHRALGRVGRAPGARPDPSWPPAGGTHRPADAAGHSPRPGKARPCRVRLHIVPAAARVERGPRGSDARAGGPGLPPRYRRGERRQGPRSSPQPAPLRAVRPRRASRSSLGRSPPSKEKGWPGALGRATVAEKANRPPAGRGNPRVEWHRRFWGISPSSRCEAERHVGAEHTRPTGRGCDPGWAWATSEGLRSSARLSHLQPPCQRPGGHPRKPAAAPARTPTRGPSRPTWRTWRARRSRRTTSRRAAPCSSNCPSR